MDYEMPFWSLLFRKSPSFGRNSFTEAARSRLIYKVRLANNTKETATEDLPNYG